MTRVRGISISVIALLVLLMFVAGVYIMSRPPYASPSHSTIFYGGTLMRAYSNDHLSKAAIIVSSCQALPDSGTLAGDVLSRSLVPEGYYVVDVYGRLDNKGLRVGDVLNAVEYLRDSRGVEEIGLIGLGCGGYLVLMAAAQTNVSFVIDAYGFSNLYILDTTIGSTGTVWEGITEDLLRACDEEGVGRMECLLQGSPVAVASSIDAPVLILHGSLDEEVPVSQSIQLEQALKEGGNNKTKLIVYDGLGHGFPISEGVVLQDILSFLRSINSSA